MTELRKKLKENQIEIIFTDYYDTLVHRKVHPNYVIRIWSKIMINELGLDISIDRLYFTYKEAVLYLVEKLKTDRNELHYKTIQEEVFIRLNNTNVLQDNRKEVFLSYFEEAHLRAEMLVQYIDRNVVDTLKEFKNKGNKVYLVSDFYAPKSLFIKLLEHHKILDLFDGIFISSSVGKSKHTGSIFPKIINELSIDPKKSMMIGDNKLSDSKNAEKAGLHSFVLPHGKYLRQNKLNGFGNDKKKLKKVITKINNACNSKEYSYYSEYVIFYHFFVERLYLHCKLNNIKSLFFLSREGLFIKRLFDSYLKHTKLDASQEIRTHYLKVSRQASLQISLNPIDTEDFTYLKRKYKSMSVREFLSFFNFNEDNKVNIIKSLNVDGDMLNDDFFNTDLFKLLKSNSLFKDTYEAHRMSNKKVFSEYISSFNENIKTDGMNVVDIGWGGTMQEAIYNFFNKEVKVTGLYLGLNTIYSLNSDTKRHGLNFSILPYKNYDFHILRANLQLYEQFSGAGHGCCVEYKKSEDGYTIEHHEENERLLYENVVHDLQNEMFEIHEKLLIELKPICYEQTMVDSVLIDFALKTGLKHNFGKIKFLEKINSGYYQNISNKKTGIEYVVPKNLISVKGVVGFLLKPENFFRYIVKLKQKLYKTNKILALLFPTYLLMAYFKFNRYIRTKILSKVSLLNFNYSR